MTRLLVTRLLVTRLLVAGLLAIVISIVGLTAWPTTSAAADVTPTPSVAPFDEGLVVTGDPRSEGEGPGIVGSPLAILAGVVLLGLATAGVTVVVLRVRGDP